MRRARTANLSALGAAFLAGGIDARRSPYDEFLPRPATRPPPRRLAGRGRPGPHPARQGARIA